MDSLTIFQLGEMLRDCQIERQPNKEEQTAVLQVVDRHVYVQVIKPVATNFNILQIAEISHFLIKSQGQTLAALMTMQEGLSALGKGITIRTKDDNTVIDEVQLFQNLQGAQLITLNSRILFMIVNQRSSDESQIAAMNAILSENPNLLVHQDEKNGCFFTQLIQGCSRGEVINAIGLALANLKEAKPEDFQPVKVYLFDFSLYETSAFQSLMRKPDSNEIFDGFLKLITCDELNENNVWKKQVLHYAFSQKRFDAVFVQDQELPQMKDLETFGLPFNSQAKQSSKLLQRRMQACNTLTDASASQQQSIVNWHQARRFASDKAKDGISLDYIRQINAILTDHEPGIDHPGVTRDQTDKTVRLGGSWTHMLCPSNLLKKNLTQFDAWLSLQQEKCDKGIKNPLHFAAQAYQRLITLHPFENGNGRTAKLLLDGILERYSLPPAILKKEFHSIGFSLEPIQKNTDHIISNVLEGIEESSRLLNDELTFNIK